ncbi:E3 ubiquitin/ISG15 ligase TRIM25 isoform X2 [Alosa sapidissima]|uniref:E3 ubiquitin/ISG15 ligase TRIM25 isoform X2 n=1 Tax=Alosa sapidissima TaxID=34773 RepID=UPI001C080CCA|nr:E3 ubiquitin/ISG15 ligase TRIM25 isoform X2 [Alosa sapidissima]
MADDMPSLLSLEEELTCSICLCTFENPVTLPCGHNFCQGCLDETWKESFLLFCPQCRHHYPSKPELKKNTVLSTVANTFKMKSSSSGSMETLVTMKEAQVTKCDTCMEVKAFKTCLTCMASFCIEHVKPHEENPIFRAHQLTDPLGDLQERICQDHCKIMEFYCKKHECSICSNCLQQVHRGCDYTTPQDRRTQKETEMRGMLSQLDRKIEKNNIVMAQMRQQQLQLEDDAVARKTEVSSEYQFIRNLIDMDERNALKAVDKDLESGQTKLQSLSKKFGQNVEKMNQTKAELNGLLSKADSLSFLQASVQLPPNAKFDPYCPRINLDSKAVMAYHSSAVAVKELLNKVLSAPVENRISLLKPDFEKQVLGEPCQDGKRPPFSVSHPPVPFFYLGGGPLQSLTCASGSCQFPDMAPLMGVIPDVTRMPRDMNFPSRNIRSPSPGAPLRPGGQKLKPAHSNKKPEHTKGQKDQKGDKSDRQRDKDHGKKPSKPAGGFPKNPSEFCKGPPANDDTQGVTLPRDVSSAVKRNDLLQFGTVLKLDPKTAHKRIALTEDFTKASVAEEPCQYPDGPQRFGVCSQVLCAKGFAQGRHYWEVKMSSNNFCGLGLAYASVDRKGPSSRLGRNAQSWCVEWFNVKLSAWHNSTETVLHNPNPSRVGVLLDCDSGTATFYTIADRAYPFHTFVFPFQEAVYPAFWIFSAGSSISLCKLTA